MSKMEEFIAKSSLIQHCCETDVRYQQFLHTRSTGSLFFLKYLRRAEERSAQVHAKIACCAGLDLSGDILGGSDFRAICLPSR